MYVDRDKLREEALNAEGSLYCPWIASCCAHSERAGKEERRYARPLICRARRRNWEAVGEGLNPCPYKRGN